MSTTPNQDKLAALTGISKAEQDQIFQEVRANSKRLVDCVGPHDFSICLDRRTKEPIPNPTPAQSFGAYWRCTKCAGYVNGLMKLWYENGLRDGIMATQQDRKIEL